MCGNRRRETGNGSESESANQSESWATYFDYLPTETSCKAGMALAGNTSNQRQQSGDDSDNDDDDWQRAIKMSALY